MERHNGESLVMWILRCRDHFFTWQYQEESTTQEFARENSPVPLSLVVPTPLRNLGKLATCRLLYCTAGLGPFPE